MVDALRETRRVLRVGGLVIDTRPRTAPRVIETVTAAGANKEAEVESRAVAEDDAAADDAIRKALSLGWFVLEQNRLFDFVVDCDTAADLKTYAEACRGWWAAEVAFEDLEARLRARTADTGLPVRLRWHRPSKLSVYRKT